MKRIKLISSITLIVGILMISVGMVIQNDESAQALNTNVNISDFKIQNMAASANMIIQDTNKETTEENKRNVIVKLNLKGKLVEEKTSSLEEDKEIIKLIPTFNNEAKCDGYIGIANSADKASLIKYDRDFNLVWTKDYEEDANYKDIEIINKIKRDTMSLSTKLDVQKHN